MNSFLSFLVIESRTLEWVVADQRNLVREGGFAGKLGKFAVASRFEPLDGGDAATDDSMNVLALLAQNSLAATLTDFESAVLESDPLSVPQHQSALPN